MAAFKLISITAIAERVLSRSSTPTGVSWSYINVVTRTPFVSGGGNSNYYAGLALTPPREFGVNHSYKFGSK